jgi:transcriptional regulator of arginine metabolism
VKNSNLDLCILSIIQKNKIKEQSELREILRKKGHNTPQSTLSRHLNKLKIAKVGGIYKAIEFDPIKAPPVLNAKVSDSGIIVLHTYPGHANSLAYFIDQRYVSFYPQEKADCGILGTMAGDDTVLIIIQNNKIAGEVLDKLSKAIVIPDL